MGRENRGVGIQRGQKQAKNPEIHEKDGGPPGNAFFGKIRAPLEREKLGFKKTRYFGTNFQKKGENRPKRVKNGTIRGPKTGVGASS